MTLVNCATPAMVRSCHLSRKDVERTATAPTRRSPGSSARTAAAGIIAAVWDTSTENSFVNYVDNFLLTSDVSLTVRFEAIMKSFSIFRPIDLKMISIFRPIFSDILLPYCICCKLNLRQQYFGLYLK